MKTRLLDSFKLIEPFIPPYLLSTGNLARMEQIASWLPPVHRAGFEYEFGGINGGLDFQQGISLRDQEVRYLLEAADGVSPGMPGQLGFLHSVFNAIKKVAGPASTIHPYFRQLWLEFDCRHPGIAYNRPSLFLALVYQRSDFAMASKAICRANELLSGQSLDPNSRAIVNSIFQYAAAAEGISHAGFMIGREEEGLRLVLPIADAGGLEALLTVKGWKASKTQVLAFYPWLAALFPEVRLCIDIKDGLVQRAGFECFFNSNYFNKHGKDQIPEILEALTSKKLCDAREAKFVKEWPGWVAPNDCPQEWPSDLLVRSIGAPENSFLLLARQLSHIKFSDFENAKPTVKAYFGYVERTIESRKPVNRTTGAGVVEQLPS